MVSRTLDNLPTPSMSWRDVPSASLVMHQAKAVCGVFSLAVRDTALAVKFWWGHWFLSSHEVPQNIHRYKALGNSMAVPCMSWIGERIEFVDRIKVEVA